MPKEGPYDFSKQLFPLLLEMGRPLYGHVFEGYWQDIGNLDQYRQANFDALDEHVRLSIPGFKLRGNVWVGEGVEVDDVEGVEGPAFIGADCRIAPDASVGPYSVLSAGVTLREHARVSRSVIDAGTYVGRNAIVEGAILGRNCDVRSNVHVHEGVAVGDQVTLGAQIGDLPGRPDLPVQGGRDRRGAAREPDLGVAHLDAAVRPRLGHGARERRPDARAGGAARRVSRHDAEARLLRRRDARVGAAPTG